MKKFFCCCLFFIIKFNYAIANEEGDNRNLSNLEKMLLNIKNTDQACKLLNNKIVSYIDTIFYVKNCKLMKIVDPEVSNNLVQMHKKTIVNLPPDLYSKMKIIENYTYYNYDKDFNDDSELDLKNLCKKYNKNIVTSNNFTYYYIENCKKRIFKTEKDLHYFSKKSNPIFSLKPREISIFPSGKPLIVEKRNDESVIVVSETEIKQNLPSKKVLCKNLENKIVSFHNSIFFLSNCRLYVLKDFNLEIQKNADKLGGIKELSVQQILGIPQVGSISSKEVIKKMR